MFSVRRRRLPQPAATAAGWERGVGWAATGWKPIDTPAPWQQTGAYGDAILSQYPARWEGAQLWGGVGSLSPYWSVPTATGTPYWQQTVTPGNVAGAQRYAGAPGNVAGAGPIASRQMKQAVLQAQVAQSGVSVMSWVDQLRVWSGHAAGA